jgi:hypothetical protein
MRLHLSLILLFLFSTLLSQTFTEVKVEPSIPIFEGVIYSSVAHSDVDGDGDQDVLIAGENSSSELITNLYLNDGQGNYLEVQDNLFERVKYGSIVFVDVDGDLDDDVFVTGENSFFSPVTKLYLNDGQGGFAEEPTPFVDRVRFSSIAAADVDGDDDMDLLVTGFNSSQDFISKLYLNNGQGQFTLSPDNSFEGVRSGAIAFADVDGDIDKDILITGQTEASGFIAKMYINDGMGGFMELENTPFEGVSNSSVAFSDVDGDTDIDVLITGQNSSYDLVTNFYYNDGFGNYFLQGNNPFDNMAEGAIAFSDVDDDGDEDLLFTGDTDNISFGVSKLFFNDGEGNFTEEECTPFYDVRNSSVAFIDIDGDLDLDALILGRYLSSRYFAKLYTNDGQGNFREVQGTPFVGTEDSSIESGDIDGDDDLDIIITGNIGNCYATKLYVNGGNGNFSEIKETPFEAGIANSLALADVDGDNDLDVLLTGFNNSNESFTQLYINNGQGNFSESQGPEILDVHLSAIAFGDVDGDTDLDLLLTGLSSIGRTAKLYLNDGLGNFTIAQNTPFDGVQNGSVAFGDIDEDMDLDVLITGINSANEHIAKLYANDGLGGFVEAQDTPFEGVVGGPVAFADIDGDDDQDILISGIRENGASGIMTKLYVNNGQGDFLELPNPAFEDLPFNGIGYTDLKFSDLDADGDQDLLLTGGGPTLEPRTKYYNNDGVGNFSEVEDNPFVDVTRSSAEPFDMDGDSDIDVLITGYTSSGDIVARLYENGAVNFLSGNSCNEVITINSLFGQAINQPQTSQLFDNSDYSSELDPSAGIDCFEDMMYNQSIWFSFQGDGEIYQITSIECNASNYITNGDTQVAIYKGDCNNLTPVVCNDNEDVDALNFQVNLLTEPGETYFMIVDGNSQFPDWEAVGEFCIEVIRQAPLVISGDDNICALSDGVFQSNYPSSVPQYWDITFLNTLGDTILSQQVLDTNQVETYFEEPGQLELCVTIYEDIQACKTVMVGGGSFSQAYESICEGESYMLNGQNFSEPGQYEVVFENSSTNGCDSTVLLTLETIPNAIEGISVAICEGEIYSLNGQEFNSTGAYEVLFENGSSSGCDSIIQLDLNVLGTTYGSYLWDGCVGDVLEYEGQSYSESGSFSVLLPGANSNGCDSIVQLSITLYEDSFTPLTVELCEGDSVEVAGTYYTTAGAYEILLSGGNQYGCDSTIQLDLSVLPISTGNYLWEGCAGDTLIFEGQSYATAGDYTVVLSGMNENGCDSLIDLTVVLYEETYQGLFFELCEGETIEINNETYSDPGDYEIFLSGANQYGCDSIINLQLNAVFDTESTLTEILCAGETFSLGGSTFTESGDYTVTLEDANEYGCDSTIFLNLSYLPAVELESVEITPDMGNAEGGIVPQFIGGVPPYQYSWSNGATTASIVMLAAGTYGLTITDGVGCAFTFSFEVELVNSTSQERLEASIRLYPNPVGVGETIFLATSQQLDGVRVFGVDGRALSVSDLIGEGEQVYRLSLPNQLATGVYWVEIVVGEERVGRRVLVVE